MARQAGDHLLEGVAIAQDNTVNGAWDFDTTVPTFTATYTRHIVLDAGAAVVGGTAPSPTTVGTFRGLGFDADNEVANLHFTVPSDWDESSNMTLDIHWFPTSGDIIAENETVKWDISYRSIATGEAVDNGTVATATATFTGGASEADKEHYETSITIPYTGGNQPLTVDDDIGIQFDRDVSGDDYTGAGIVFQWHLEYTSNALPE